MSLQGGHWVWSASLRYAFMLLFLAIILAAFRGPKTIPKILAYYWKHWLFWTIAGSIGFGGFYSLICFSADHAPGWVIAATWQLTIIASLVVLVFFNRSFPKKIWAFSVLIFLGVLLINTSEMEIISPKQLLYGALPVVIAAFCYPLGNQLVWEAKNGRPSLPNLNSPLLEDPFAKVVLLTLGSVPFWLFLLVAFNPAPPSGDQIVNTAMVALFSGVIATSLFLLARNKASSPSELAAVDATQSSEVIFALAGEIIFLNAPLPTSFALVGMVMVFTGLFFFIWLQESL